jgi:hypothetical protein
MWSFLIKDLIIGTFSYFGADFATEKETASQDPKIVALMCKKMQNCG